MQDEARSQAFHEALSRQRRDRFRDRCDVVLDLADGSRRMDEQREQLTDDDLVALAWLAYYTARRD